MSVKHVLVVGCFDPLHIGHIEHLKWAKKQGDYLVVGLTDDEIVRYEKGDGKPFQNWEERAAALEALRSVDSVVRHQMIKATLFNVRPDIYVKGIDYTDHLPEREYAESLGITVLISPTPKWTSKDFAKVLSER